MNNNWVIIGTIILFLISFWLYNSPPEKSYSRLRIVSGFGIGISIIILFYQFVEIIDKISRPVLYK